METAMATHPPQGTSRNTSIRLTIRSKIRDVLEYTNVSFWYWKKCDFRRWALVWFSPYISATIGGGVSFNPDRDIPDLGGKVIFITGGNTGIGKEAALQLASHNPAKIFLTARSEPKGLKAIHSIRSMLLEHPQCKDKMPEIIYLPLDLSKPKSIEVCATEFRSRSSRLDILILNAGTMYNDSTNPPPNPTLSTTTSSVSTTPPPIDIQVRTNHLGHFYLFNLLLPSLQSTPRARIVVVSSEANNLAPSPLTFTASSSQLSPTTNTPALTLSPPPLTPIEGYAFSKAMNIYFASHIPQLYPQLSAVSLHPGLITTAVWDRVRAANPLVVRFLQSITALGLFQPPAVGAWTVSWAAVAAEFPGEYPVGRSARNVQKKHAVGRVVNGAYYTPVGRLWTAHPRTVDVPTAQTVWDWSEQVVGTWKEGGGVDV